MTPRDYVQYGSLMTPPAPFDSLGAELFGFIAQADGALLDALCAKVFTEPADHEHDVVAIGDRVMITWGRIARVVSEQDPFAGYGGVAEPQVVVWVPVAFVDRPEDGRVVAERFAMFVPYIWVDNAMSLATGRELFGYPKAWGEITFPAPGEDGPRRWGLSAYGIDRYDPEALAGAHPLMEITEGDALEGDGDDPWHEGLLDLARDVADRVLDRDRGERVVPGLELAAGLAEDLLRRRLRHVFLKQVRTIRDEAWASLQQITECRYEVRGLRARPRLREFSLTVHELDSHPLVAELGLHTQAINVAYEVTMDFRVAGGKVLWPEGAEA